MNFRLRNTDLLIVLIVVCGIGALGFILDVIFQVDPWSKVDEARGIGALVALLMFIICILSYKMIGLYKECDKCVKVD